MKKSIILFTIYGLIAVVSIVLIVLEKPFDFVVAMAGILIAQRILIIRALKPNGLIHGNGLKYFYEKQGRLEDYKKILERSEIVMQIILTIGVIACTIVCL